MARGLLWSGASFVIGKLPAYDSLLVLNYHRIGNAEEDPFDPELVNATADEFDEQIAYLKRHVSLITLDEAIAFVEGSAREARRRFRVLITFDDGYLDNYTLAFPVLRSHSVPAAFFLSTGIVGSCHIPWWDHVAYVMKSARQRRFTLHYPGELDVEIDARGIRKSVEDVLMLYKSPRNTDPARFLAEVKEAAKGDDPPQSLRRFLNWEEAREMLAGGMAIGSHTHSHPVLSQLTPAQQGEELTRSRQLLKTHLDIHADALAYPVGFPDSFSHETRKCAEDAGYRVAFSYYGGINVPGNIPRYDVKRISVGYQSWERFRVQTNVCRFTGSYWP